MMRYQPNQVIATGKD